MVVEQLYQASVTVTTHEYGRIAAGYYKLPPNVKIVSAVPDGGGNNVAIILQGSALGSWALMSPVPCELGDDSGGNLIIQPIGGSSSSSGIS